MFVEQTHNFSKRTPKCWELYVLPERNRASHVCWVNTQRSIWERNAQRHSKCRSCGTYVSSTLDGNTTWQCPVSFFVPNKIHRGDKDDEASCRKVLIAVGRPPRDNVWCVELKVDVTHTWLSLGETIFLAHAQQLALVVILHDSVVFRTSLFTVEWRAWKCATPQPNLGRCRTVSKEPPQTRPANLPSSAPPESCDRRETTLHCVE